MFTVSKTNIFIEWLEGLRDREAQNRIKVAIRKMEYGNLAKSRVITGSAGLSEIKLTYGPGYRLYYTIRRRELIILLCGGDKGSQMRDIKLAKELLKEV